MEYRGLSIDYIEDCDENKGGYFCTVSNSNVYDEFDYFCIHVEDLEENLNIEYWVKKYIDVAYYEYLEQGLINKPEKIIKEHDIGFTDFL